MQIDVHSGLRSLAPEELQRLDQLITPELAGLLTKAFPDLGPLMQPLIQNDQPQQGGGFAQSGMAAPLAGGGQRAPY